MPYPVPRLGQETGRAQIKPRTILSPSGAVKVPRRHKPPNARMAGPAYSSRHRPTPSETHKGTVNSTSQGLRFTVSTAAVGRALRAASFFFERPSPVADVTDRRSLLHFASELALWTSHCGPHTVST